MSFFAQRCVPFGLLLVHLIGCSEGPAPGAEIYVDSGGPPDSTMDFGHVPDDGGSNVILDGGPIDSGFSRDDDSLPLAKEFIPVVMPERWESRRDCEEVPTPVEPAATEYAIPTVPFRFDPDGDIDYLRSLFGEDLGTKSGVWFPERHNPGDKVPYDVFADPGGDVEFTAILAVEREPATSVRLDITVLVDYRPVAATLSIEDSDRNVREIVRGSGHSFLSAGRADFIAVTIPANEFESGKNHEIGIALGYRRRERARNVLSQRISLFYGGLEPAMASIPCTPSQLGEQLNEFEQRISIQFGGGLVGIFPDPVPAQMFGTSVAARPGETRRIYFTALRTQWEDPNVVALVPTMNGEPVADVIWRSLNGPQDDPNPYNVDDRGFFDVTLPEEPGIYEVYVQTWEDPWVRWREFGTLRPAGGYDDVVMVRPTAGSNVIRFVVEE